MEYGQEGEDVLIFFPNHRLDQRADREFLMRSVIGGGGPAAVMAVAGIAGCGSDPMVGPLRGEATLDGQSIRNLSPPSWTSDRN